MRGSLVCLLLFGVALAGCANQTPAQQAATLACVEDQAGKVLSIVATDFSGAQTGTPAQLALAGASGVLVSASADQNCATAIQAASGSPPAAAAPAPAATTP
jgi:hypothetical protein